MLAVIVPMLAGCPTWVQNRAYKDYAPPPLGGTTSANSGNVIKDDAQSLVSALEGAGWLNESCYGPPSAFPLSTGSAASGVTAASAPQAASASTVTVAECVKERNHIISDLLEKSDRDCEKHKATIFGNQASWNVALGTLTNAFTGTAAVVGGPVGKSIFSALGLFSNAERSLVNEEVYQNTLVPAITQKIDSTRDAKHNDIIAKSKADTDLTSYPMTQAISDLVTYHGDCSFMFGLQHALTEGTGNGVSAQYLALKRAEQSIKSDMDVRQSEIRNASKGVSDFSSLFGNDELLKGLTGRLKNVEDQLKVIETIPSSRPAGT